MELTKFKAREYHKPAEQSVRAASVGGGSGKTTPSAALMAVVKEFKLHSLMRSQQREEFEKKKKEKDQQLQKGEIERLEEIKRKEEEEVRRIRAQMMFKASKIKKYRFVVPDSVMTDPKQLTVP